MGHVSKTLQEVDMRRYYGAKTEIHRLACLFLIAGLIFMTGCATSHNKLAPVGVRPSALQSFEGTEAVLIMAAGATLLWLGLAVLVVYLVYY